MGFEDLPRPALTADVVALTRSEPHQVLLIQRANPPFQGSWALPGGFVEEGEHVRDAPGRELHEETGMRAGELTPVGVYDAPDRDPRGWSVTVAFLSRPEQPEAVQGGDDARAARWFPADDLPRLAFDHDAIIADAIALAGGEPTR